MLLSVAALAQCVCLPTADTSSGHSTLQNGMALHSQEQSGERVTQRQLLLQHATMRWRWAGGGGPEERDGRQMVPGERVEKLETGDILMS